MIRFGLWVREELRLCFFEVGRRENPAGGWDCGWVREEEGYLEIKCVFVLRV